MVRHFFRLCIVWGSAFCVALLIAAFALPWWFDAFEKWRGAPLPYEGALRFAMLVTLTLLLFCSLAWIVWKGRMHHWVLWGVQTISYASLLVVFFGDTSHRLMEEFSWIRYTTAGFLFCAAVFAAGAGALYYRERSRVLSVFWLLISGAFLYAGADELFEIHEAIGSFLQKIAGLPSFVTDLVTMSYAVVALVLLVVFFRTFFAEYKERYQCFVYTFLAGGLVYFVSTLFDTVDMFVGRKLRVVANTLAIDPSFVFGDAWYAIWAPRNFFNGWEEVFEHTAAALFFSALLLLVMEKRFTLRWQIKRKRWVIGSIVVLLSAFFLSSLVLSSSYVFAKTPAVSTNGTFVVSRIAGYFDGLSHTDDLFYHPAWGVLVANEGKGNIYQWKDGRWGMMPDPKKVLRDMDSVTADAKSVYVSDGSQGTIFRSSGKGDWEALWTKKDGLKHPEGIVVVDNALYVVDESEKSLTKLVQGLKPEVWRPSHPDWRAPEGIAYDKKRGALVVTDDVSGVVFAVDFGKTVQSLAKFSNPEDVVVAPDGRILVTDNGWGVVFAIMPDGKTERIVQFRRSYRDLQGITTDDAGRLYVVTADGFDRVSFMPSMLFQITPPFLP